MRHNKLYTAILAVLVLASCSVKQEDATLPGDIGKEVRFTASMGQFATKADAAANTFAKGKVIGLTASSPIGVTNMKLTAGDGGTLTSEKTIYWPIDAQDTDRAEFTAVYPYGSDPAKPFTFTVKTDQSTAAAADASDLLVATATEEYGTEDVALSFYHGLSRLVLRVDNGFADDPVKSVTLSGVKVSAKVDIPNGVFTATGSAATVKPYVKDGLYCFIIAPQEVNPVITVSFGSGRELTYDGGKAVKFASGKQVAGTLAANPDEVGFQAEVFDWMDNTWGSFFWGSDRVSDGHEWYFYGDMTGWNKYPLEEAGDGVFSARINNYLGGQWFYLYGEETRTGMTLGSPFSTTFYLDKGPVEVPMTTNNYYAIRLSFYGDILLEWKPSENKLIISEAPRNWEFIGTGQYVEAILGEVFSPGWPYRVYDVDVYEDSAHPGTYGIKNLYNHMPELMAQWEGWSFIEGNYNLTGDGDDVYFEIVSNADGNYYIPNQRLGLKDSNYGDFRVYSPCAENGFSYSYYGWKSNAGTLYFSATIFDYAFGSYRVNNGMAQLILPGSTRERYYVWPSISWNGDTYVVTEEPDVDRFYASIYVRPNLDTETLQYCIFRGRLTDDEADEYFANLSDGTIEESVLLNVGYGDGELVPGLYNTVDIEVDGPGVYTLLYVAEGQGWQSYGQQPLAVTFDGYDVPDSDFSLSVSAKEIAPDATVCVSLYFPDNDWVGISVVSAQEYSDAGYTEDDYYDYAKSFSTRGHGTITYDGGNITYTEAGLLPETEYIVIAAGKDLFGRSHVEAVRYTTAAEPEFSSIGEGTYLDQHALCGWWEWRYNPTLEFMQASDGSPRYRIMRPYAQFWEDRFADGFDTSGFVYDYDAAEWSENHYAGYSDPYFDFWLEEGEDGVRYVCFMPFHTGYLEYADPEYLTVYRHFNLSRPSTNNISWCNRELVEGVFGFNPVIWRQGSDGSYSSGRYWTYVSFYFALPGYDIGDAFEDYPPAWAPARKPGQGVLRPVEADDDDAPGVFTRHPLKARTPVLHIADKSACESLDIVSENDNI